MKVIHTHTFTGARTHTHRLYVCTFGDITPSVAQRLSAVLLRNSFHIWRGFTVDLNHPRVNLFNVV